MLFLVGEDGFAFLWKSQVGCECPVAVPDKIFGLTLFLDFIDRCHSLTPSARHWRQSARSPPDCRQEPPFESALQIPITTKKTNPFGLVFFVAVLNLMYIFD